MTLTIQPVTLQFKQPAGTSRGVYTTRRLWYILVDGQIVGECAPLPALSCDDLSDYEERLCAFAREVEALTRAAGRSRSEGLVIPTEELRPYPSMLFGFETASWYLQTEGFRRGLDTPFARGERGIPFNGLIWMGPVMLGAWPQSICWAVFMGVCLLSMAVMLGMVKWLERVTNA